MRYTYRREEGFLNGLMVAAVTTNATLIIAVSPHLEWPNFEGAVKTDRSSLRIKIS